MRDDALTRHEWRRGICFRCAQDEETVRVSEIRTPLGEVYPVRACRRCLRHLETQGRRGGP